MKFVEYQDVSKNRIRELQSDRVRIHQNWYPMPCAISAQQIVTETHIALGATAECFAALIAQQSADLILVGRPQAQLVFDIHWHQLLVQMNQQGVGLEQMSHAAAVRTFNVLMTEERPFWLVLV